MSRYRYVLSIGFAALFAVSSLAADKEHATIVREGNLYVLPGSNSEKLAHLTRGRDLVILERTNIDNNQPWYKVFATIVDRERERVQEITGWLPAKGIVTPSTPNGDEIIFGEAVDSEQQAEQRGGRKGAAEDALRLYFRITELFPNSPITPEAMWRSADIRWQIEKAEVMGRPSARDLDPDARNPVEEQFLKDVIKKFPHTKWADLAAYNMIDNKLCGDWKGLAKCPEKESEIYEKYAREHPQSPKVSEALYNAAWRQAVLIDIYKSNTENEKSVKAKRKAQELGQQAAQGTGDWRARALDLMYKLDQNIPLFGNAAVE
ncbi:MAG TPA: hypothetical protein VKZ53_19815 [Candidatus Angelobacter sp.]|nr:hypothetical protein [Candidatus Angelobacter sp.]